MSGWLIDTNVISELRKPRCSGQVTQFIAACPLDDLFISVATIAEIRQGIAVCSDPMKRATLENWLDLGVRPQFEGRTLPVNEDVMALWLLLVWNARKTNETLGAVDSLLAATALVFGLTVLTRDVRPFQIAGASVRNPWHDQA